MAGEKEVEMVARPSPQDSRRIQLLEDALGRKGVELAEEQEAPSRSTGSVLWFIIITLCSGALPPLNLTLLFFQPFQLIQGIDKNNLEINNVGRLDNFTLFYAVMGSYAGITFLFVVYSCFFGVLWQRAKMFLMVDNILICMLATDVAYTALHLISFCSIYSTDEEYNLTPVLEVLWQDYAVIILYAISNFALVGCFRVLMVYVYWRPWQIIIYKLTIILTSLLYIALGLVYIFGQDTLSKQVDDFATEMNPLIDYCYEDADYFSIIPYLQRMVSSLGDAASKISNFMIFYVFTNFAFSFEIVAKLTDFDGTSDLKTSYQLEDDEPE